MNVVIETQSMEQANRGEKVLTSVVEQGEELHAIRLRGCAILEKGQESGKTSVMLIFDDGTGRKYLAQATQDIFKGMAQALDGAIERFGQ